MTFRTLDDLETFSTSYYIDPLNTACFDEEFDSDFGEDVELKYKVTPGTKEVRYSVTKYREITKYRTITKYRQEQVCD